MWSFLILYVLSIDGAFTSDICSSSPTEYCDRDKLMNLELPSDLEDFNNKCSQYLRYVNCLDNYEEACPENFFIMFFSPGDKSSNYKLIREICDNSTTLNAEFVKHAVCLKNTYDSESEKCRESSETQSEEYLDFLSEQYEKEIWDLKKIRQEYLIMPPCLSHIYAMSCLLTNIEESCGVTAADLGYDLAKRSIIIAQRCSPQDLEKLETGYMTYMENKAETPSFKKILD